MGGYAFGDSAPAARRLGLLADLFEPASRAFLAGFAGRPLDLAVDAALPQKLQARPGSVTAGRPPAWATHRSQT